MYKDCDKCKTTGKVKSNITFSGYEICPKCKGQKVIKVQRKSRLD